MRIASYLIACTLFTCVVSQTHADWLRFRGPNGEGVSTEAVQLPTKFGNTENLAWKVELPGAGVSSPIVVGDKVFVTCYSGYGLDRRDPGEMEDLKRHLVCVDSNSGKILWDKPIKATLPEDPYTGMGIPAHGYASHTPVSDGERIYVFFGKTGALAFDLEGNQLWQKSVGTESDQRRWGSASSPILFEDILIVTASAESEALVGLNTMTGEEVWRKEASGLSNVWGTPVLAEADGRTDLVLGVPYEVWGFDPTSGKFLWYCEAAESDQYSTSVVVNNGVVYGMVGSMRGGGAFALRPGGKGDTSKSAMLWTGRDSARFASPVVFEDRLYSVDGSIANCFDAKTGERLYQKRLSRASNAVAERDEEEGRGRGGFGGGGFGGRGGRGGGGSNYASPVIGDGKLFYVNGTGTVHVIKLGDEFEELAVNKLGEGQESFGGSPAIADGSLFFRSSTHLYRIGK